MANPTAKRILIYTGLFAGASILACPAVGMGAGVVVGATAVAALFGNTLASDIHAAFTRGSVDSLSNHHLQELVGRSLAILIECYEKAVDPPNTVQQWIPLLRRPDAELSALAKSARKHWDTLRFTGESAALQESDIHKAFSEQDRTSPPLISSDEWSRHLAEVALYAQTRHGDQIWLREEQYRSLAEYIAPRFATAVRQLVKADLDPSVGAGGRVFIALHLDLMRSMSMKLAEIDTSQNEQLKLLQQGFDRLSKELGANQAHLSSTLDAVSETVQEYGNIILQGHDRIIVTQEQNTQSLALQIEQLQEILLAELRTQPAPTNPDPATERDLVAGVDRVRRDIERGSTVARAALAMKAPTEFVHYLTEARLQLDLVQKAVRELDEWIDGDKINRDREIAALSFAAGLLDKAKPALERILTLLPNDVNTYNRLIDAQTYSEALATFARMKAAGAVPNCKTYGRLVDKAGSPMERSEWLEKMRLQTPRVERDAVIYTILINKAFDPNEAREWWKQMQRDGVPPDAYAYNTMIKKASDFNEAREWFARMLKAGFEPDLITLMTLRRHAFTWRQKQEWRGLVKEADVASNAYTYNALIGKAESTEEAAGWFDEMRAAGIQPNVYTYNVLIGKAESAMEARGWFDELRTADIKPDVFTYNSLISKAANAEDACEWFERMQDAKIDADVFTYTSLICKSANAGDAREWLERMRDTGIEPNAVTYTSMARFERERGNKGNPWKPEDGSVRDLLGKALVFDPHHVPALIEMMNLEAPQRPKESEQFGLRALELTTDRHTRGWICFQLGMMLAKIREGKRAIVYFESAVRENPNDATSQAKLAKEYSYLSRWEDAEKHFQIAMNLNPEDNKTYQWHEKMKANRRRDLH
jgi:pentatricopeptide repeat protein